MECPCPVSRWRQPCCPGVSAYAGTNKTRNHISPANLTIPLATSGAPRRLFGELELEPPCAAPRTPSPSPPSSPPSSSSPIILFLTPGHGRVDVKAVATNALEPYRSSARHNTSTRPNPNSNPSDSINDMGLYILPSSFSPHRILHA